MNGIRVAVAMLLLSAVTYGKGEALYRQGLAVYKSDSVQALELFVQAAEEGHLPAMTGAGYCFETGIGTEIDYAKAIEWYEKAVEQNSLKACERLAHIYASCADPKFHNGAKAVKYATAFVRKNPRDADALVLLAAARARNMEFKKAEKTQSAAQKIASLKRLKGYKQQISKYAMGEPFPPIATDAWIIQGVNAGSLWAISEAIIRGTDQKKLNFDTQKALQRCQLAIDEGQVKVYALMGDLCYYSDQEPLQEKAEFYYKKAINNGVYEVGKTPLRVRLVNWLKVDAEKIFVEAEYYRKGRIEKIPSQLDDNRSTDVVTIFCKPIELDKARFRYLLAIKKGCTDARQALEELENYSVSPADTAAANRILSGRKISKWVNGTTRAMVEEYISLYYKAYLLDPHAQRGEAAYRISSAYSYVIKMQNELEEEMEINLKMEESQSGYLELPALGYYTSIKKKISTSQYILMKQNCHITWRQWNRVAMDNGNPNVLRKKMISYATYMKLTDADAKKALGYAQQLLDYESIDFEDWDAIARVYARCGKFEEAIRFQKNAIEALHQCPQTIQKRWSYDLENHLTLFEKGKPFPAYR